jgi:hypothetical protein
VPGKSATATAPRTTTRSVSERLSRVPAPQAARDALVTRFRMPGTADPSVRLRRLAGISTWAAVLGFAGMLIALRIMIGLFSTIPTWYLVVAFALGAVWIGCTLAAFGSVHRSRLPWILLGTATAAEAACIVATFV